MIAMMFSNKVYDILVWITTIVLPALGTLYFALAGIWGFPYGEQIVGTITAIVTFLGALLRISNRAYKNGNQWEGIVIDDEDVDKLDDAEPEE
jgi:hypothetical protein